MNAAFVTLARWARSNGWTPTCTTLDSWRDYRWQKDNLSVHAEPTPSAWHVSVAEPGMDHLSVRVTSIQQAVDHLVTAGVLPAEFHSLSAKPTGSYYDLAGTRAYFADREPSWCPDPLCDDRPENPCGAKPDPCRCGPVCDGRPDSPCQVKAVGGAA